MLCLMFCMAKFNLEWKQERNTKSNSKKQCIVVIVDLEFEWEPTKITIMHCKCLQGITGALQGN